VQTLFLKLADLCLVWLTLCLSAYLYGLEWDERYSLAGILGIVLFQLAASELGIYRAWRTKDKKQLARQTIEAWLATFCALVLIAFLVKTSAHYSRQVIVGWLLLGVLSHCMLRFGMRLALSRAGGQSKNLLKAIVVGAGETGIKLAEQVKSISGAGITIVGFYDDLLPVGSRPSANLAEEVIGDLSKIKCDVQNSHYDIVYVALPVHEQNKAKSLIDDLSDTAVAVHIAPDICMFNLINSRVQDIGGIPVISVYDSPLHGSGMLKKRFTDIALSLAILTALSLPMLMIAVLIRIDSPGPVLFKQRRFGLTGREIWVWKFRSMHVHFQDGETIQQAQRVDPRITSIGAFLRKTSLDELPQFLNVIAGTMSVVGPRPHAVVHNEIFRTKIPGYMQRHLVKPGITGWAQVNGWRGRNLGKNGKTH
jgi:putative colanic acid biosynthesis UDP-glucose lipid carrier transferase